jgi:hypothetical protein
MPPPILADKWTGIVSVDYRLLHHFRVSQRRQMASRGELPVRFNRPESSDPDAFDSDEGALDLSEHRATRLQVPGLQVPDLRVPDLQVPHVQVLTHLLNEDR